MIEVKNIWDDIENAGLAEYVSKYEIWLKAKELKEFLRGRKIILESGKKAVYFFIFLYFLVLVAGFGYIWQGMNEGIGHRIFFGAIYAILSSIALYIWISKRFTAMTFILDKGIICGISNKEILKKYGYDFSYIPYSAISDISVENRNSEIKLIVISTKDGKIWQKSSKYEKGYFLVNKRSLDKYLKIIYERLEKNKQ